MADLNQMFSALEKADAAGNVEDARQIASMINAFQAQPQPSKAEEVGFIPGSAAALKGGIESLGDVYSGLSLAKEATLGTEAETARKMQAIKAAQQQKPETPQLSAADIERIYKEQGLGAAAAQVPKYISESILQSAPQMAVPLAAGAAATPFLSPVGGAVVGMGVYGIQQFGNFLVRQAQEKDNPKELEVAKAATTAAITAPLGYYADRFTAGLGGMVEKKAGEEILKELTARQIAAKVGKRAAVGATEGIIAEAPVEVLEQAAERYQAGLSLTGEDAMKEYKEAFFGAAAAGAGIGGVSRGVSAYQEGRGQSAHPAPPIPPQAPTEPTMVPSSQSQDKEMMMAEAEGRPYKEITPPAPPETTVEPPKPLPIQAAPVEVPAETVAPKQQAAPVEVAKEVTEKAPEAVPAEIPHPYQTELNQLYKDRNQLSTVKDNLNIFLRKVGINTKEKSDMGIESGNKSYPYVFRKEAKGLDVLMHDAIEHGIISEADLARYPDAVEGFREMAKAAIDGDIAPTAQNMENLSKLEQINSRIEHLESIPKEDYARHAEELAQPQDKKLQEDAEIQAEMDRLAEASKLNVPLSTGALDEDIPFAKSKLESPAKNAENVIKSYGHDAQVVYDNKGLSLIKTRSPRNGDVIYTPSKNGKSFTQLHDIDSKYGKMQLDALKLNENEKNELLQAKEKLEAEEKTKHEKNPFLSMRSGVSGSPKAPKDIVNVARGWAKMLGMDYIDIHIITKEEAIANKDKFTGPHRPIGWMGEKLQQGAVRRLDDGSYALVLKPSVSKSKALETIAHELGHIHEKFAFDAASEYTQKKIIKEFNTWLASHKNMSAKELVESMRPKTMAQTTQFQNPMMRAIDAPEYWRSFREWYADQVARWAVSSEKPLTVVDKFFAKLAAALKKFYATVKGQKYLPNESMKNFLDNIARQNQFDEIADRNNKGQMALFADSLFGKPRQTDTPEFKRWFGNSKVVNEDGSPKVVYHGTDKPDFSIFDPASWFSENPAESSMYARPGDLKKREKLLNKYKLSDDTSAVGKYVPLAPVLQDFGKLEEGKLYAEGGYDGPVYKYLGNNKFEVLSNVIVDLDNVIDNPDGTSSVLLKKGRSQQAIDQVKETKDFAQTEYPGGERGRVYPVYLSIKNPLRLSALEANRFSQRLGMSKQDIQDQINKWKAQGYDGIITTSDEATMNIDARDALGGIPEQYIPFDASQIKSATGNTGAFNPEEADIRFAQEKVEAPTKEDKHRNVNGQIVSPVWTSPEVSKIDDLLYKLQDKHIDTKRVIEEITKTAGLLDDRWNVYLQEELYHGRTSSALRDFLLKDLLPTVKEMKKLNVSPEEMNAYLHFRHAEERNNQIAKIRPEFLKDGSPNPNAMTDKGSGKSYADIEKYFKELDPSKEKNLKEIAKRFDAMVKDTQNVLVKSGAETQDTINAWNNTYKNYAPLFRVDDDFASHPSQGTGSGFGSQGPASKRATGSTKEVQDIMGNIIAQRERALIKAEKIRVGKSLYGAAIKNPNPKFWLPVNPDAIKSPELLASELEAMGLDGTDIVGMMEEKKKPEIYMDPQTGLQTVRYKVNPLERYKDNVFPVRINGKDRYIFFNQNDPRAKRMVEAMKNLDPNQLGEALGTVGKLTRWFAAVNTQYNPVFGGINLIRDVQSAMFNLSTTKIAGEQKAVTSGIYPAMRAIYATLRAERAGKELPDTPEARLWHEFRAEGGQTLYRDSLIRKAEEKQIVEHELEKLGNHPFRKAFMGVADLLSDFNDTIENSVRLSAYKVAVNKGISKEQAASIAKNLTVNFDRKGALGSNINALYAFFNASMQGSARLVQTLKGPMGRKIVGGGILIGSMQAIALAAAGFDEDEPPEFIKEKNLVIPLPDHKYALIPMPLGLHLFPNIGRETTEWAISGFKNPGKHVTNMMGTTLDSFNPLGGSNLGVQTLTPTLLDPLVALEANKDAFGRPIYKADRATNPTPGYLRSREGASEISKLLSEFLNYASGGTEFKKGAISPTGDALDYLAGQFTGGAGREVMKTEEAIKSVVTGEELPAYRVPLAGRFYGDIESKAADSQRFYENVTRLSEHENEIKGRQKSKGDVLGYLRDNPEAKLWQRANNVENQISQLNKRKKDFQARGLPKEKITAIDEQKQQIMRQFNNQVKALQE